MMTEMKGLMKAFLMLGNSVMKMTIHKINKLSEGIDGKRP